VRIRRHARQHFGSIYGEGPGIGFVFTAAMRNPWVIAVVVAMAAFMQILDTSIANVALPHMAGNLGITTGARYSLLLPENATGNYVKVVQRVPVKILFDQGQDPDHLLRPGMSVVPSVKIR
jgi:hypothetical protein